jgi:hypothetical protein
MATAVRILNFMKNEKSQCLLIGLLMGSFFMFCLAYATCSIDDILLSLPFTHAHFLTSTHLSSFLTEQVKAMFTCK